jgi:hypothetical protein
MSVVDPAIQASYKEAIARRGRQVKFRRVTGDAPNVVKTDATVKSIVMSDAPDPLSSMRAGYSDRETGALTQDMRKLIVMVDDLTAQGFPLPLRENDLLFLDPVTAPATNDGRRMSIAHVDPDTRALAGAIEVIATGVQ